MISRRTFIVTGGATALAAPLFRPSQAAAEAEPTALEATFAEIEKEVGGRLGVAVASPGTSLLATRRGDERFPMCSTFKLLAVAAVLHRVDEGEEMLSRDIPIPRDAILEYAPVTEKQAGGTMTVSQLCEAAVVWSDNTAANLILESLGGPEGATAYVRTLGDDVTRIDRMEPELNLNGPDEVRDTTTPNAILGNLNALFLGEALSPLSRDRLTEWFVANETGKARLKAGLPPTWRVGDRTGTGPNGTSNDIGVAWRDVGPPILIAAYITGSKSDGKSRDAALADVGRAVAASAS
ncbi:MAG: class A beta-lactamase [Methyloceanibacter sp.]|nr:class A beta-lactamase [Methyloceanibacter sp.]